MCHQMVPILNWKITVIMVLCKTVIYTSLLEMFFLWQELLNGENKVILLTPNKEKYSCILPSVDTDSNVVGFRL